MKRVAIACLAALALCSACVTAEDLECWYDDWCKDFASADTAPAQR